MRQLQYLFVTTHFAPDYKYGGVVHSSIGLYKYLSRLANFKITTVSETPQEMLKSFIGHASCYRSIAFHRFGVSLSLVFGLWRDIQSADVLLINGIFTMPVTLAQIYALIMGKPFVVATRGGLEPWRLAHKKWKKYVYLKLIVIPLMRRAKFIHTTSDEEKKHINQMGFVNVLMVPNGIDVDEFTLPFGESKRGISVSSPFVFLFMSRTDKEKGLDILLSAYRSFCAQHGTEGHLLKIVGPDHQGYLRAMNLNYVKENIEYVDGVYGDEKLPLLCGAEVIVLPSYSENFGNIIAEALACSRPVITTTGTPWASIQEVGCGWYIEPKSNRLLEAMIEAYTLPRSSLDEMGALGRAYILKNFSWGSRAKELFEHLETVN